MVQTEVTDGWATRIRAPRAEVPLHRAKPQVCVGLVSGPSPVGPPGAAPGKGLARF